jgi:hypothetical protein
MFYSACWVVILIQLKNWAKEFIPDRAGDHQPDVSLGGVQGASVTLRFQDAYKQKYPFFIIILLKN